MTEAEWLATTRPYDLTHYKACRSARKRRLLSAAFARRVLTLVPDDCYQPAIETAERYADGLATEEEMRKARRVTIKAWKERKFAEAGNHAATAALATLAKDAVMAVHALEPAGHARASLTRPDWQAGHDEETRVQCVLTRDVFGNPFRPVKCVSSWLTPRVRALALGIYQERSLPAGTLEPDRLLVLADALEEAGCDNTDILAHCRGAGPHVRGCWVVDLLLGKE
jgi:hypothetical protein